MSSNSKVLKQHNRLSIIMCSNKFIFISAVILATLIVILLAKFSPVPHQKQAKSQSSTKPWLALSLYIQQVQIPTSNTHPITPPETTAGALIFHRALTEGPQNTSRVVGKAQGFIIPIEHFAHSGFNIIYLTFNTNEYSGSVSIQAKNVAHGEKDELIVVGGTGSFAFARGIATFARTDDEQEKSDSNDLYRIKLDLKFPNRSQTIPG